MNQIKSKERVSQFGEVFTAPREVNAMLDLVKDECDRVDSKFLEPACGEGAFLVEILRRKLTAAHYMGGFFGYEHLSIVAVASIFGIDIQPDNVGMARQRLFDVWLNGFYEYFGKEPSESRQSGVRMLIDRNIVCGDFLTGLTSESEQIWFLNDNNER